MPDDIAIVVDQLECLIVTCVRVIHIPCAYRSASRILVWSVVEVTCVVFPSQKWAEAFVLDRFCFACSIVQYSMAFDVMLTLDRGSAYCLDLDPGQELVLIV